MDARVGPYRILRLINDGGQGRVFLGYDDRLRRRVDYCQEEIVSYYY